MKNTPSKPKKFRPATIFKAIPNELERHIEDVLDHDTQGGREDSATGRLVRDWNAGLPMTAEHLPALLNEARHLLSIIEDADEWQEYTEQARDRRELRAFIRRFA